MTGNHWVSVPCIHPADGSIHAVGTIQRQARGAVEFAGGAHFETGDAQPLLRLGVRLDGDDHALDALPLVWQRGFDWIPSFQTTLANGGLVVRGTISCPTGPHAMGMPGVVYAIGFENRSAVPVEVVLAPSGVLGHRQYRVRTGRALDDRHTGIALGDSLGLSGSAPDGVMALAIGFDDVAPATCSVTEQGDATVSWEGRQHFVIPPGGMAETALYIAVAPEIDGALAMLSSMSRRGWRLMTDSTKATLLALQQSTGVAAVDRLMNRHLMFAYFGAVARALDDAQLYLMRSRMPWNGYAHTVREWEALMWVIPAIQLVDPPLGRELLVRMCEIHGYAPGASINYIDGIPFRSEFVLEGAAAYALAVDRYIAQTGDDRIVEEPAVADTLYASHEDIAARRDPSTSLYATEVTLSGTAAQPYTLHGNAVVAEALDVLRQTLDEKTAEKVESGDLVRSTIRRVFSADAVNPEKCAFVTATDLQGAQSTVDDPLGSAYWLPVYDLVSRSDTRYQRTVAEMTTEPGMVASLCASLVGPSGSTALDYLRRFTLDNGIAAEQIDVNGVAVSNGGDAALSGLVAYSVWYAVTVLGVRL